MSSRFGVLSEHVRVCFQVSVRPSCDRILVHRRVKMTRLRARVAERLKGAQNTYAMLTTFNEIDMTNLMKLRADFKVRNAPAEQHT